MSLSPAGHARPARTGFVVAVAALSLLALALRLAAAQGDLSIDEVWSLYLIDWFASHAAASGGVALALLHDNTHPLNSLYMWLVRALWTGEPPAWAYRMLSVAAGTAMVPILATMARPSERLATLIGCLLLALSFPLVQYDAEARGYALMLTAALVAFLALDRWQRNGARHDRRLFVASATTGCLSHLLFLPVLGALGLAALAAGRGGLEGGRARLDELLGLFFVPAMVGGSYAVLFLTLGFYGKSEPTSLLASVLTMASVTVGLAPVAGTVAFAVAAITGIALLARRHDPRWLVYLIIVVVAPAMLIGLGLVHYPQPRYFLTAAFFGLLASCRPIAAMLQRGGMARGTAALLLAGFVAAQGASLVPFFAVGRGGYSKAVAKMLAVTPRRPVRVGGNQDYRIGMLVRYYARRAGGGVVYIDHAPFDAIDWYIEDIASPAGPSLPACLTHAGTYLHAGLSGQTWLLYRDACRAATVVGHRHDVRRRDW